MKPPCTIYHAEKTTTNTTGVWDCIQINESWKLETSFLLVCRWSETPEFKGCNILDVYIRLFIISSRHLMVWLWQGQSFTSLWCKLFLFQENLKAEENPDIRKNPDKSHARDPHCHNTTYSNANNGLQILFYTVFFAFSSKYLTSMLSN